jgi:hypothetical protein
MQPLCLLFLLPSFLLALLPGSPSEHGFKELQGQSRVYQKFNYTRIVLRDKAQFQKIHGQCCILILANVPL